MTLPRCFGVFGDPVAHSRSPVMHAAAFAALGLPHRYLAFHVAPADLAAAISGARALGFGGVNLTVPHKQAALAHLDECSPTARRIGAVNTLRFTAHGVCGDNTDGLGFVAAAQHLDSALVERAVVLGSGGAALAVLDGLVSQLLAPTGHVAWVARNLDTLTAALAARPWLAARVLPLTYADLAPALVGADLLVNTTTVGMHGGATSFPVDVSVASLAASARVIDLVYPRPAGGLLDRAEAAGHRGQAGQEMLLWQGVRALELWLGEPLPATVVAAMRQALMP